MKFSAFFVSFALIAQCFSLSPTPFEEVEDRSNLPLLNPDFAELKTLKIRFQNGLELLILSDPAADQSAAAVAVDAGSWNDPEEYAGMAHFCEHMLFMGTEKYPDQNEFLAEVNNFGGGTNAYTAPERTVYAFSCNPEGFLSLLDRFGHFFIDPIFDPSNISREMHAVDQEFAKNLENDTWRTYMVWKEAGNQKHPNRMFSTGNSQTLANIPQSALKEWHQKHYGANRMHIALYSSLPLETLKEKAIELFQQVPESGASPIDLLEPLFSPEQRGHITYIQPIQNRNTLILNWELPPSFLDEPAHTAKLLAYALNRGQKYSLEEELKKEGLVDGISIGIENLMGKSNGFFQIYFELTEKGIEEVSTVALRTFQALAALRATGIPSYLFEEKNQTVKLHFQHQSRESAFSMTEYLAATLPDEPLETYPRKQLLGENYSSEKISSLLALFTPANCAVTLLAPFEKTKVEAQRKEKWMGTEYAIHPIPSNWLTSWSKAKPHAEILLPEPNPFLPTQTNVISENEESPTPLLLSEGDFGTAYYARCPEYPVPETVIHLHIFSPVLQSSAESQVFASIYIDHLTDLLQPTLKAAGSAKLSTSFDIDRSKLHFTLSGFSEKVPLLLQDVLKQMPLDPPTPEQFAIYFDRHQKAYSNAEKELAFRQGKELLDALVNQDEITSKEKLAALEAISYDDFLDFHKKLFEMTFFEALFAGNLTLADAESAWLDIIHALGKNPYPKEEHPQTKVLHLPDSGGPFLIHQSTQVLGNATLLLLEEGDFSFERKAAQEVLASALKEAFFNELRTKQKTGYIAASGANELEGKLFQIFLVQSNSHQPEDLLYRFELFLEEYLENFSTQIPPERFEQLVHSTIHLIKTGSRNLEDKADMWDTLAFARDGDFTYFDHRIEALQSLLYDTFCSYSKEFLSRANRKRLAILVDGKLTSPFSFESLTPIELQEIANYSPRMKEEAFALLNNETNEKRVEPQRHREHREGTEKKEITTESTEK